MSNFDSVPQVRFSRSKFDLTHSHKTSFNLGELVPLDLIEILPGDTFKTQIGAVIRATSSFIRPVMDDCYMDIHSFFVPYRLLFNDYERVFGNPNPSAYVDNELVEFPVVTGTCYQNSVGDYLGLPINKSFDSLDDNAISVLPFRAFALVYNQWFRNQNVTDETYVRLDSSAGGVLNNNEWSPNNIFGKLPKVSKGRDLFTSCIPNPQKGAPVQISLGNLAPVVGIDDNGNMSNTTPLSIGWSGKYPSRAFATNTTIGDYRGSGTGLDTAWRNIGVESNSQQNGLALNLLLNNNANFSGRGMYADLSNSEGTTINELRFAFQLQKMLERDALYGSRINEFLLGHFGVTSPDSRLQITEYLGGGRFPISIQQVAQTSQSTEQSSLASVGGYSLTNGFAKYVKGFTEHGFILTVGCIKQRHTYCQGVDKLWTRKGRNDFYDPLFANLGEQPIYTSQLYYDGNLNKEIFGYNEAWAEYRSLPNKLSSNMRTTAENTLDVWHFGDKYDSTPYLTKEFDEETPIYLDRTLSVPSTSMPQFVCDLCFKTEAIRVMPTYSVPGLIDHH